MEIQEDGTIVVDGLRYFPDKVVHDLRDESARYRTRSAEWEKAVAGLTDAERNAFLGVLNKFSENDEAANTAAALELRDIAHVLLQDKFYEGLDINPGQETPPVSENNDPAPPGNLEEIIAAAVGQAVAELTSKFEEQETKRQQDAEVERVFAEVKELGFEPGSPEFAMYLRLGETYHQMERDVAPDEIAKQVRLLFPSEDAVPAAEGPPAEGAPRHPSTVDAGSVAPGSPGGNETWLDKAKAAASEKGAGTGNFLDAARAAAEAWHDEN